MTTTYVTHKRYRDHEMAGFNHPEHPGRIESVWATLEKAGLTGRLQVKTANPAPDDAILSVHAARHLDLLRYISMQDKLMQIDGDTYAIPDSAEIARLSAGGVLDAIDDVCSGESTNALAAVRPPGHHATPSRAMGFCILSNIAIGARYAQTRYNIRKVMIVDFDVHHGNGTQDTFYEDESVLFISTHQYPFYPGTGAINETGNGSGVGTTLNIPLKVGVGDQGYLALYEKILWPAARRYKPDLILVSAGFDAHFVDPLAHMRLSLTGYTQLSRQLVQMAEELCDGKIVFVMEGGYDLQAIGHGMRNIAHVLLGDDEISDIYGPASGTDPDVEPLIDQLLQIHAL